MKPVRDATFYLGIGMLGGLYLVLIIALLIADLMATSPDHLLRTLARREIRYAITLSLVSSSITAILSMWVAVPLGYVLARRTFIGKKIVDMLIDVPIVLPPLVIGLSLLLLFQTLPGRAVQAWMPITYAVPGVILAQFTVSAAFATRTMQVTFEQISSRTEEVAMTLGCSRSQAFWLVTIPEARRGMIAAGTLAWARALGEFGPILLFAGATRMRTEVMPTAVFLELSVGNIEVAVAISLLMIAIAFMVLFITRRWGVENPS